MPPRAVASARTRAPSAPASLRVFRRPNLPRRPRGRSPTRSVRGCRNASPQSLRRRWQERPFKLRADGSDLPLTALIGFFQPQRVLGEVVEDHLAADGGDLLESGHAPQLGEIRSEEHTCELQSLMRI